MIEQRKGVIVNIASFWGVIAPDHRIYGYTGIATPSNYGAAKAGLIQLTRWLATSLAPHGIRVNCISPGGSYNPAFESRPDYLDVFVPAYNHLTPLGRMGNDTHLKGAIVYLAPDASAWVTGQNLIIDGGRTAW